MSLLRPVCAAGLAASLFLAGCGAPGAGTSSELSNVVSAITAPYALLDLATGTITWRTELTDAASNPAYRDGTMAFRRVGSDGSVCLVGIFEITQAQWTRLDGTSPWLSVATAVVPASAQAGDRPAYALDYDTLSAAVTAYRPAGTARLAIPTAAQWTLAAGTASGWTWGATATRAQLDAAAWVHETVGNVAGPRAVGSLSASPLGFYDLHGNVWEWAADGTARGGSWQDSWRSSRVDAIAAIPEGLDSVLEHALIGARLVLLP